jgi:hypothetical protein
MRPGRSDIENTDIFFIGLIGSHINRTSLPDKKNDDDNECES